MAVLALRSIAQGVPTVSGCVCEWLSKAKKQAPVESYTKEKVPYLHSHKAKYKKWKKRKSDTKRVCVTTIQKSYQKLLSKREKREERHLVQILLLLPKFATKATVSPCVGVTRALVFVRTILVTFAHFLGHTNLISLVLCVCFRHFGLITIFDILIFGFSPHLTIDKLVGSYFWLSTYPPTTIL